MLRLFRYSGNKLKLVPFIQELLLYREYSAYVEPFLGSGAIFYNIQPLFENYHVNDIDPVIVSMHTALRDHTFYEYEECNRMIDEQFGDIENDKEAYYSFRNSWNALSRKDWLQMLVLASCCLNSMLRFGPNGMNQSYGHRRLRIGRNEWEMMRVRILNARISSVSYDRAVPNNEPSLVFLDHPYPREMTYNRGFDGGRFIEWLVNTEFHKGSTVVFTYMDGYFDMELRSAGFTKREFRNMNSTSPNRDSMNQGTGKEVVWIRDF